MKKEGKSQTWIATPDRSVAELLGPWFAVGVGVLAFVVYLLTLAPGLVPGRFSIETIEAMNLLPGTSVRHPLWLLVTRCITSVVPVTEQVYALNVFSAVCGALAVARVVLLARRGYHDLISEIELMRPTPVGEIGEKVRKAGKADKEEEARTRRHKTIVCLGGIVAAVALALNVPFWISSNSLHSQTFDLLLFVLATDWAIRYHGSGLIGDMLMATFLFFLGLVESVYFIWLLPVFLFLLIRGGIRFRQINESFFLLFVGVAFIGAALNTGIYLVLAVGHQAGNTVDAGAALAGLLKSHSLELQQDFSAKGWMLVLCQTLLPLAVALGSLSRFSSTQNVMTRCKWNVISLIFSAAAMLAMSSVFGSVWRMTRESGALPVYASLCAALALGGFFVYWLLVATEPCRDELDDHVQSPRTLRTLWCYGMCVLLCAMTFGTVPAYLTEADGRKTRFADHVADIILDQTNEMGVKCLLTEGVLDVNLLVRARVRGLALSVLPYRNPAFLPAQAVSALSRIEEWMRLRPESSHVATVGALSFWQGLGIEPVPCGLLFIAKGTETSERSGDFQNVFNETVRPAVSALGTSAVLCPELETVRKTVRKHASRMANDMGVYLETLGTIAGADVLYVEAERIDADNICAVFNRYGLLRRYGLDPDAAAALASRILMAVSDPAFAEKLADAVKCSGRLAAQPADLLVPLLVGDWGTDASIQPMLIRVCRNWLQPRAEPRPARVAAVQPPERTGDGFEDVPEKTRAMGALESKQFAMALDFIPKGMPHEAEERLRVFLKQYPDNLSAWTVLADILLGRNALSDIREKVLPAMRRVVEQPADGKVADQGSLALIDLTEGCVYMQSDPPDLHRARTCFLDALAKKPDLPTAHDSLLRVSMALGNVETLEEDSMMILSMEPSHARANAVLGSRRMSQEQFDEAERLFKISIAQEPLPFALNDYAELLRKQKRVDEAEGVARRSIQASPAFYPAWDSLSAALREQGRLKDAHQAIQCALVFEPRDARLHLTYIRVLIDLKRIGDAEKSLERAKPLLKNAPADVRKDFESLKSQLTSK